MSMEDVAWPSMPSANWEETPGIPALEQRLDTFSGQTSYRWRLGCGSPDAASALAERLAYLLEDGDPAGIQPMQSTVIDHDGNDMVIDYNPPQATVPYRYFDELTPVSRNSNESGWPVILDPQAALIEAHLKARSDYLLGKIVTGDAFLLNPFFLSNHVLGQQNSREWFVLYRLLPVIVESWPQPRRGIEEAIAATALMRSVAAVVDVEQPSRWQWWRNFYKDALDSIAAGGNGATVNEELRDQMLAQLEQHQDLTGMLNQTPQLIMNYRTPS